MSPPPAGCGWVLSDDKWALGLGCCCRVAAPHAHPEAGAGGAYLSSGALTISSGYTDTQEMLARSTNQSRAAGFGQGQVQNFSHAQHQPFHQQFGQSNPAVSSKNSAAQQQQTFSAFGPIPHQAQSANGPFAAAQSQPPAIYTPQVFQQVVQPISSSAQHCFPTWNPNPQVAQAPSYQPHPVTTNGPFAAAQSQPPAIYNPQVFQQVVQPISSSAQHCFPTWNPNPQVAQAPSYQPHPVATNGPFAAAQSQPPAIYTPQVLQPHPGLVLQPHPGLLQGRPRADMPAKLAAVVCPVLSINCRQGHGLICISGKPARYPTWCCDLCHQLIPHDTKHVMHCDKCACDGPVPAGVANGFDICPACRAKARDAMSVWPLIQNAVGCPMFPGVGDYWQTLYCHRQHAPCEPDSVKYPPWGLPPPTRAPCGPREGAQCLDCKRGQDALIASAEGKLLNRAGRAMHHVCFRENAGTYFCSECSQRGAQCDDCKFTQANLPEIASCQSNK
jgi:hypothetical protein